MVNKSEAISETLHKWRDEIAISKNWHREYFVRCDKITRRYRDESDRTSGERGGHFNLFWSNLETTKELIYSRQPLPDVSRRWKDRDPTARAASELLERGLSVMVEAGLDAVMRRVVLDFLLYGRGVSWERYVPSIEGDELVGELSITDYVWLKDFLHSPGCTWPKADSSNASDVWWVARRATMTREQLVDRFGDKGEDVPMTMKRDDSGPSKAFSADSAPSGADRAEVYEIWDRRGRECIWIATGYDDVLDQREDPLKLSGFFPCPEPFYGTLTNDSLIPVPDYVQLQHQLAELDDLTGRIDAMTQGLRVAGVCDGSVKALQSLLDEGADNRLIPIDNWQWFRDKGAIEGAVSLLPMEQFVSTLISLHESRDKVKDVIYEISGLSDIIRGASDPNETAAAQKIKGRWAGNRIRARQTRCQQFVRDVMCIKGEIIAEHFDIAMLSRDTGLPLPTNADKARLQFMQQLGVQVPPQSAALLATPSVEDVQALLRADRLRMFRVDIETDSTLPVDDDEEKASRMELVTAVGEMLERAGALVQASPEMGAALKELIMFAVRGFKGGRAIEESLEQALDAAAQSLSAPKEPSPEQQLAQGAIEVEKGKLNLDLMKMRLEMEKAGREFQLDELKLQAEQDKSIREFELQAMTTAAEQQLERAKLAIDAVESAAKTQKASAEAELALTKAAATEAEQRLEQLQSLATIFKAQAEQQTALIKRDTELARNEAAKFKFNAQSATSSFDMQRSMLERGVQESASHLDDLRRSVAADKASMALRKKGPRKLVRDDAGIVIGVKYPDGTEARVTRGADGKIEAVE